MNQKVEAGARTLERRDAMRAVVGDRLHVHGRVVGSPDQTAEIIEIRGRDGGPPYLVRRDDGHELLVFPGADTSLERPDNPSSAEPG